MLTDKVIIALARLAATCGLPWNVSAGMKVIETTGGYELIINSNTVLTTKSAEQMENMLELLGLIANLAVERSEIMETLRNESLRREMGNALAKGIIL